MISELIVIFLIIFCALVFYYSQSVAEYSLSQIKETQVQDQIAHLWEERKPVVISECKQRGIWTGRSLKQTRFWGAQPIWGAYEGDPAHVAGTHSQETVWADILGLTDIESDRVLGWFNLTPWIFKTQVEAHIGAEGLRPTYAHVTNISCTEGEARCILLHSAQKAKMPPGWANLPWKDATVAHHPLWIQIQCIEVILRPGTSLCVPPHWIVAVEPVDPSKPIWWTRTAVHHPISWIAEKWNS